MPPNVVKSVKDLILWQYTGIISESSGFGRKNFPFRMSLLLKFKNGEMNWSTSVKEWKLELENSSSCIYCGSVEKLTTEHILPKCLGGEDCTDNVVRVCKFCNSSKGGKRLYEWKGLDQKGTHSRIAEGKYLKYLYRRHEKNGTLDCDDANLLCKTCSMTKLCEKENTARKLTVYCIEGCFHREEDK